MSSRSPALGFIFITLVLDILGVGLIVPILPKLIEKYEGGDVAAASLTYGLLHALYALMQFLFAPLIGSLSDRFGRRPVILISLFGAGLDYLLIAYAPNLTWFVVGRIIAGITGANFAAATAYIADISPPEKRAANFGLIGAAFGLGFTIGPVLGGWLGQYGLQVPFLVAGGLTLVNWLYGLFVLPESLPLESRRPVSWDKSNPVGALLALKLYPSVLGLAMTSFLFVLGHQVYPSIWVLYTDFRYGWDTQATGLSLGFVGVMTVIVQGKLTKVFVSRFGEVKTGLFGLALGAAMYVCYGLCTEGWMIYVGIFIGSLSGVAAPALQGLMSRSVPADQQGGLQGSLTSLASLAGIIGPPMCSGLFGYFISDQAPVLLPGAPFFVCAAITVVAVILAKRALRSVTPHSGSARESSPTPFSH
jgi:DHA1 family tetracycline resistance protein-like MFS transporter